MWPFCLLQSFITGIHVFLLLLCTQRPLYHTVQPFHPWSVRKRRCRRPLSFGRTSGSRLLHSQLTLFTVYYRLEEVVNETRNQKKKKNIQNRSEEFSQQTSSWCPARGRNDVDVRERSSDARIKKIKRWDELLGVYPASLMLLFIIPWLPTTHCILRKVLRVFYYKCMGVSYLYILYVMWVCEYVWRYVLSLSFCVFSIFYIIRGCDIFTWETSADGTQLLGGGQTLRYYSCAFAQI